MPILRRLEEAAGVLTAARPVAHPQLMQHQTLRQTQPPPLARRVLPWPPTVPVLLFTRV
jgi:hypothetical protein